MSKRKYKLLLKKELKISEVNDILSGYVIHKYENSKIREYMEASGTKFNIRFEYKDFLCKQDEVAVIVEVHACDKK